MLNDTYGFQKVYLAVGTTDLRKGIEGLAGIVKFRFNLNPYVLWYNKVVTGVTYRI